MIPDSPPWSAPLRLGEIQRGPRTLQLAADATAPDGVRLPISPAQEG